MVPFRNYHLPYHPRSNIKKNQLSMVVLGHVDAGKSTLMGQVLLQTGHVQQRILTRYQKQAATIGKASFALAWVMDEDESERQRGITMEVATKYLQLPKTNLVILDAPGHADFIPAMIHGAATADVAILVVAATKGEFEAGFNVTSTTPTGSGGLGGSGSSSGGQTREHVVLARGLGVSQLIVAVNKLDAMEWDQERFRHIQQTLLPFLTSQAGFAPKRIRFIPVSGLTGENVKASKEPLLSQWYKGPTLLEAMDTFIPAQRTIGTCIFKKFIMCVFVIFSHVLNYLNYSILFLISR